MHLVFLKKITDRNMTLEKAKRNQNEYKSDVNEIIKLKIDQRNLKY